jgi:hypothetical protein
MTGIEIPLYAAFGIAGMIAGAGGSYAATRKTAEVNSKSITDLEDALLKHTQDDDRAFREILRSLGRIEGTLQELNRSK